WVRHVSLPEISSEGFLCDECYAFWLEKEKVDSPSFIQFDDFLKSRGLDTSSVELNFLDSEENEPIARKWKSFSVDEREVLPLIDEAWSKRKEALATDPRAYVVNLKKIIGTDGETCVKILVRPGTQEVIAAYPVHC